SSSIMREKSSPSIAQIEFSWVLVDLARNVALNEYYEKTSLWPSSTKQNI
ncbi:7480_t:CDS:1, partial [Gigaspora rosea]